MKSVSQNKVRLTFLKRKLNCSWYYVQYWVWTNLCNWGGAFEEMENVFNYCQNKSPNAFFGNCQLYLNNAPLPSKNGYLIIFGGKLQR